VPKFIPDNAAYCCQTTKQEHKRSSGMPPGSHIVANPAYKEANPKSYRHDSGDDAKVSGFPLCPSTTSYSRSAQDNESQDQDRRWIAHESASPKCQ